MPLQSRGKAAGTLVDVRALLGDAIEAPGRRPRDRRRDARRRRRERRAAWPSATRRSPQAARAGGLTAAAQSGHRRGQPGTARALLVLPPSRPDLLAGGRRHLLRADRRPPQARPRGRATASRSRPRTSPARCSRSTPGSASSGARAASGACRSPSSTRVRARITDRRVQLARGELITAVELPAPPDASAYERAGERAAWSFALAGVAAARFGAVAAAGRDRPHERAAPARPGRSAGRPARARADGLEARARRRAVRARACPRQPAIIAAVAAYDVAVIGAGTTGASIAYFLTQRGLRPVVFEKTRAAGGPSGASAGMCRRTTPTRPSSTWRSSGCEFLADMKARTGFQSGYAMSGYLVVGPAEREAAIRGVYETMRGARGRGRVVRRRPHPRARAAPGHARSHHRLLRADGRPCPAAVRRRRLRARRRARRRDAPPRHARDGACVPTAAAGRSGSATARARARRSSSSRAGRGPTSSRAVSAASFRSRCRAARPGASGRVTPSAHRVRSSPITRRSSGSSPRGTTGTT